MTDIIWISITQFQWDTLYIEDIDPGYMWSAKNPVDEEHYPDYIFPTEGIGPTNLWVWWERTPPQNRAVKITRSLLSAMGDILDRTRDFVFDDPDERAKYNSIKALVKKVKKLDPDGYKNNMPEIWIPILGW